MRILIISLPRTGSTSLLQYYCNKYKLTGYSEPFHPYLNNTKYYNQDNSCVKSIVNQTLFGIDSISFFKDFSSIFDKIILLSRKNLIECAESYSFLMWNIKFGHTFDKPYVFKRPPNYDKIYETILEWNSYIIQLSDTLSIPVSYYEELFDKNSTQRLRLTKKAAL